MLPVLVGLPGLRQKANGAKCGSAPIGDDFADWGATTRACITSIRAVQPEVLSLLGIAPWIDVAKAIGLRVDIAGMAAAFASRS